MSQSISLFSSHPIEPADFAKFILDLRGEITDATEIDGSVQRDGSHVWFYGVRAQLAGEFEQPEEGVETKLGHPVRVRVNFHLSHDEGSEPLALLVAYEFVRRWPAVATCTAEAIMTAAGVERLLATGRPFPLLCQPDIRLLFATAPHLAFLIDEFSGLNIDPCDVNMETSIIKELKKLNGAEFDPDSEKIMGLISCAEGDIWIVSSPQRQELGEDSRLCSIARRWLESSSAYVARVVAGYGASDEARRIAITFAERALRSQVSVLIGLFHFVLDLEELTKARARGQGFAFEVS